MERGFKIYCTLLINFPDERLKNCQMRQALFGKSAPRNTSHSPNAPPTPSIRPPPYGPEPTPRDTTSLLDNIFIPTSSPIHNHRSLQN